MAKAMVYTFLAIAFIIFFLSPSKRHDHHRMCLNRRLAHKVSFDPLVSRIERSTDDKGLSKNTTYVPEVDDAQEYFQDDGVLNTTLRLMILFPLLDNAPKDGYISAKELEAWISQQTIDRLSYRTYKAMFWHDKDGDGAISFSEYLPQFSTKDIEINSMAHGDAGWWMEQFKNADVDSSGNLDFNECKDFLHPEDSDNEEIQRWLLRDKMKRIDDDHDGKLNFSEFLLHVYNIYKSYADFENSPALTPTAEQMFAQLDTDKDKKLSVEELRPILRYLHPGELFYAKYFTRYLMREADDNKDGYLTLQEMLNHESIFYNSLYEDDDVYDDDDDDDDYHDDL
ncbi:hypothetical protein Godav_011526 [Gossypium davidsonii]|uniref:EF-hand domain-containing protein n=1 Tax=Gossypium davidsonii TaxID=34287 RepID=A0A7J8RA57_GOSDV|nr:hypothetical protein [Gossypium davidsonii]